LHGLVEHDRGGSEVSASHEGECILRAPLAVHAGVFPLDRERPRVADRVERAEERLEVDVAVAGRDEVPAAIALAEVQMPAEDALAAVERLLRVLDVDVVDAVGELDRELRRIEELVRSGSGRG
jgi:hypothetical protein